MLLLLLLLSVAAAVVVVVVVAVIVTVAVVVAVVFAAVLLWMLLLLLVYLSHILVCFLFASYCCFTQPSPNTVLKVVCGDTLCQKKILVLQTSFVAQKAITRTGL